MSATRVISLNAARVLFAAACLSASSCFASDAPDAAEPETAAVKLYGYKVVNSYPHDENAFTQGLLFRDGYLYESTGQHGASSIRKVDLPSGEVVAIRKIDERYFGEGLTDWGDQLMSLTWRAGKGFVFDFESFEPQGEFTYAGEGWGLTRDDSRLIMSDGTDRLRFFDPETLEETGSVAVTLNDQPLRYLNELEFIGGEIYANIWQTFWIARINPETGAVAGLIDLRGIFPSELVRPGHTDVLNGIAWDPESGRLFVTGKHWPQLYEIELVEAGVLEQ